ncbi:MAG: 2-phospho-L-lactate transferase [Mycobacteriales bacterium]
MVCLAGGVGGARFLTGLRDLLRRTDPDATLTAIVNTGDDITLHGLRICPDLDTVMYTLGAGIDTERGWGRSGETWRVRDELAAYGAGPAWFGLGDQDLATHLVRTEMLDSGYPLSAVTEALCARWDPGVRLLPMTDARAETHVVISDAGGRRAVHFQEWWIRLHAEVPAEEFVQVGIESAQPAPGVLEALAAADVVIFAPSNPVVSVGTILGVPGLREALRATRGGVVGLSPIVGGAPLRGMADACLTAIGVETSAQGVGRHYASRSGADSGGGVLDAWLVDTVDAGSTVPGARVHAVPLLMHDAAATQAMAAAALRAAAEAQ